MVHFIYMTITPQDFTNVSEIFSLFIIPFGGGIPAGVILGKTRGVSWQVVSLAYLCSDILLAVVFEQLLLFFVRRSTNSKFLQQFAKSYSETLEKFGFKLGLKPSPLTFVVLSFGADPMTSRAVSRSACWMISSWTARFTRRCDS